MIDPRTPCIVGVAQRTIRPGQGDAPEPLDLWQEMAQSAARDSGGHDVIPAIDSVAIVYCMSWQYDDPPRRLAERLGLAEGARHSSNMSGTVPQKLIQNAASEILAGQSELALVVGAEALATRKRMKKEGRTPAWSHRPDTKPGLPFEDPFHPAEVAHQVFQAYLTFAVFDIARRAHAGLSPEQNTQQLGRLFAPMSRVAAANPHAWFRQQYDAAELVRVSDRNRMVSYPYPKHLVSIMDVDMASGVIVASQAKADALGIPADRRVYLRGWCQAKDPVYVAEREQLWRSVAMQEASRCAMQAAGVGIDEIAHLDLYSCFGSSVNFARDALGLADDDSRPLTVTGGLPFHGGPGSNYLGHSVATLVEKLRAEPRAWGMLSGVGMHMTNHVYAVYACEPGRVVPPDEARVQARVDAAPRRKLEGSASGPARIAAYSVVHGREGAAFGLAVCDLPSGARCYARSEEPELLRALEQSEWVGREVELVDAGGGVNRIDG